MRYAHLLKFETPGKTGLTILVDACLPTDKGTTTAAEIKHFEQHGLYAGANTWSAGSASCGAYQGATRAARPSSRPSRSLKTLTTGAPWAPIVGDDNDPAAWGTLYRR
jgi:hypothetical protein